jgi:glycine dehydrogenase
VKTIHKIIVETPEVLQTVPHFTPIDRVDEVLANKAITVSEPVNLPKILPNRVPALELTRMTPDQIWKKILESHKQKTANA